MALAALTRHNPSLIIRPTPIERINTLLDTTMKTRIRPIHHAPGIPMLHRIEMQIIHMTRIIPLIADRMLPKAPLPDTPLAPRRPDKRTPFRFRKLSCEPRLDKPPAIGEIEIPGRQCPNAMQVIRQHHPAIDHKRPAVTDIPYHGAQHIDIPDQSVIRETLQQVDRKKITATGNAVTSVIGQGSFLAMFCILVVNSKSGIMRRNSLRSLRPTLADPYVDSMGQSMRRNSRCSLRPTLATLPNYPGTPPNGTR